VYGHGGISAIGRVLSSDARATMLDALMDGAEHPVTELALRAGVAPSTATAHVATLADAGLVDVRRNGRQRRVRLSGPEVARALEGLAAIAAPSMDVHSLSEATARDQLAAARTCYDHLAGRLGVAVTEGLVRRGVVVAQGAAFVISDIARDILGPIGIDFEAVVGGRRSPVLGCIDWTEGQPHVAGALGAAVCALLLRAGAIRRRRGTRAVVLTEPGAAFLVEHLGVNA